MTPVVSDTEVCNLRATRVVDGLVKARGCRRLEIRSRRLSFVRSFVGGRSAEARDTAGQPLPSPPPVFTAPLFAIRSPVAILDEPHCHLPVGPLATR